MAEPGLVGRRYVVDLGKGDCEYEAMIELSWFQDGSTAVQVVVVQPGIW